MPPQAREVELRKVLESRTRERNDQKADDKTAAADVTSKTEHDGGAEMEQAKELPKKQIELMQSQLEQAKMAEIQQM